MLRLSTLALLACSVPAFAQEINVYSHRQPELIQPLVDAFTAETGITVNVAFVDKGMAERLQAEGDRSPADLVLTVDIARLMQIVDAGVTQAVQSDVLEANIPAELRDPARLHQMDAKQLALAHGQLFDGGWRLLAGLQAKRAPDQP